MSDLLQQMGLSALPIGVNPTPTRLPRAPRSSCAADIEDPGARAKFIARIGSERVERNNLDRESILKARQQIREYQDRINQMIKQRAKLGRGAAVVSLRVTYDTAIKELRDKIKQLKPAAALR